MKRREFIAILGGVAAAWPLAARAQQAERMRRIGLFTGLTESDASVQPMVAAFRGALAKLGWTEGSNLLIEYHWGGGDADKMRRQAAQLATLAPDVIFVSGGLGLERLLQVTRAVPIVFAIVPDPLGSGFVESLSRPGGNVTGFMMFEYNLSGKWLELLKEIAPDVTRAAVLRDAGDSRGDRPIRCHTVRGAVPRRGSHPGQHARRCRDRTRGRGLCALQQWRPDRDSWRGGDCWSPTDPLFRRPSTNSPRSIPLATSSPAVA